MRQQRQQLQLHLLGWRLARQLRLLLLVWLQETAGLLMKTGEWFAYYGRAAEEHNEPG
jgi:hypothetical protein